MNKIKRLQPIEKPKLTTYTRYIQGFKVVVEAESLTEAEIKFNFYQKYNVNHRT